jgi:hypothetical protein
MQMKIYMQRVLTCRRVGIAARSARYASAWLLLMVMGGTQQPPG